MRFALLSLVACFELPIDSDTGDALLFCTEIGCVDGLSLALDPPLAGEGSYTITVVDDLGQTGTCVLTIPFGTATTDGCDNPEVLSATSSGTMLEPVAQEIPDLSMPYVPVTATVTILKDGVEVVTASLSPVAIISQPNGPECLPTCETASESIDTTP